MSSGKSGPIAQLKDNEGVKSLLPEFTNYHKHGELFASEASPVSVSLPTANNFVIATGWVVGLESPDDYIDIDEANGTITIGDKGGGLYRVDIGASFESSRANVVIHGEAWKNGVRSNNIGWRRDIGTANQVGNASDWGHGELVPGDILTYRFASDTNATTVTLDHGTFSLTWIAGEE